MHRSKVIHIVRHAQGFHNVARTARCADPSVTNFGWQQSEALRAHVDALGIRDQVELVVVSPLLRTLQTAAGVWGGDTILLEEGLSDANSTLMVSGLWQAPHAAIATPGKSLKFVANELCREKTGPLYSSSRRSNISFYKQSFPSVDFSEIETDEDTLWSTHESPQLLSERAKRFVRWLLDRPESQIAVVSHGTFIFYMCEVLCVSCSDIMHTVQMVKMRFQNCEMRSLEIRGRVPSNCYGLPLSASLVPSTHFQGGLHCTNSTMVEEQAGPSSNKQVN